MKKILDRDKDKIEAAMNDYAGLLFTICYSMVGDYFEAEDLVQEAFLSAYRNFDKFDGAHMKAWLVKIATNRCLDYLKSAARRNVPTTDEILVQRKDETLTPEESVLQKDVERRMSALSLSLKEPYRSIAKAYFCEGLTAQEIAGKTGKNLKTVQTQIYRTKSMMKKLWKEEFSS